MALLTGGGLAALGGLTSGFLNDWMGKRRDERKYDNDAEQDARRYEHERRMAHEARHQERIARVYDETIILAGRAKIWVTYTRPMISFPGDPKPELPSVEEQSRIQSLLSVYGSPEVQERYEAWRKVVSELTVMDFRLKLAEDAEAKGRPGDDTAELWSKIGLDIKPREEASRRELAQAVAAELSRL
jgi:hypothetical protein